MKKKNQRQNRTRKLKKKKKTRRKISKKSFKKIKDIKINSQLKQFKKLSSILSNLKRKRISKINFKKIKGTKISKRIKQFKVLLYHIPKISGVSINHNIIESLISKYPDNVVGIKDSANDLNNTNTIIKDFPDFCVFSGSDSLALDTMRKGAAGAITATANISVVLL